MKKIVESKTKIRFQDCDPFNHLNNTSYLNYFMNHREDMLLKHYNLDIFNMAKTIGKGWVSNKNQIAYLKPALLMETVIIESQLIYFDTSNLKVEMRMYNEDKTNLKSIIWCGFTHTNVLKLKREEHNKELMQLFQNIMNPVEGNSFEERLQQLKTVKVY